MVSSPPSSASVTTAPRPRSTTRPYRPWPLTTAAKRPQAEACSRYLSRRSIHGACSGSSTSSTVANTVNRSSSRIKLDDRAVGGERQPPGTVGVVDRSKVDHLPPRHR